MPRKPFKITVSKERKFSPHFLDLKKIIPQEQEFEKPKKKIFWLFSIERTKKEKKIKINFVTPGEKRIKREKEELELKKKIGRHSKFLSDRFFRFSTYEGTRFKGEQKQISSLCPVYPKPSQNQNKGKGIISFLLICLFFVFSLQAFFAFQEFKHQKQVILVMSLEAYQNFSSGNFEKAQQDFSKIQEELNQFGFLIHLTPHFSQAKYLLKAGELMAEAGRKIKELGDGEIKKINNYLSGITEIYPKIKLAEKHLSKVKINFLPKEYREGFLENKEKLEVLTSSLESLVNYIPDLINILGFKEPKYYLIIFQNNNEIRPTGGFIGSFALIEVDQGEIKNLEIPSGGSYDLRKISKVNVAPPKPLGLVNSQWQIQDANWFPDFPSSAKKILWFWENTEKYKFFIDLPSKIDGLLALNASFTSELLKIVGPVEMPEYKRVITSENFIGETQKIVELESDKKEAKKFIGDLAPRILDKIFNLTQKEYPQFFSVLINALDEKEIQFYFTDQKLEEKIKKLGWAGEIKLNSSSVWAEGLSDYLMIVNTNLGSRKTDQVIKEKIFHQAEIQKDGSIINQIIITRTHQGQVGDYFTGVNNNNYLRLYVPQGSQLLEVFGFKVMGPGNFRAVTENALADEDLMKIEKNAIIDETSGTRITQEFGKTCFANWVRVKPGETASIIFKYKLPFNLKTKLYSLLWQKQSGTRAEIESQLILPEDYEIIWKYPRDSVAQDDKTVKFSSVLDKDKIWAVKVR